MSPPRPRKRAEVAMATSLLATLGSARYARARDDEGRAWMLLLDLCDALHPLGAVSIPTRVSVVDESRRLLRDEAIRRAFDGRNHAQLARAHRLTERQIRRILGTRGWYRPGSTPPESDTA